MRAASRARAGTAAAALLLAACGGSADGRDGRDDRPTVAFRPLALGYVAGLYEGSCTPAGSAGAAAPGAVELLRTGDLDAPGLTTARGALLDRSMSYTIRRDLDASGPTAIGLSVDNGTDAGLAVEITTQQGALVRVRQGPRSERIGTDCTGVAAVAALRDRPLVPVVADLLATASTPFACTGPDGEARRPYAADATGATLGDERWSFTTGLARERLYVGPVVDGDRLVYEVRLLDGRSLAVQVDDRGTTDYLLTRPSQDGAYTECRPA